MEAACNGDAAAIEALIQRLRPRLAKMAFFYSRRSQEEPDDLLQEAWIGLLEALDVLDITIGDPEQYLLQRARWRLLDAIKNARVRHSLQPDSILRMPLDNQSYHEMTSPAEDWAEALSITAFAECLNPVQRAVFTCLMSGMTWRETGHLLGCTSANVAYHVRQIRKRYAAWDAEPISSGL